MCMEDVRLGRKTTSRCGFKTLAAGVSSEVLPANAKRIAMVLTVTTSAAIASFGFTEDVTNTGGPTIIGAGGPLVLNIQQHGSFVRSQIWGISAAGATVGWMETVLEDE